MVAVQDSSTLCGTTDNSRRLFSKNLSFLTIHGHFVPLYIPHMLPTWDPDGGSTPKAERCPQPYPRGWSGSSSNVTHALLLVSFGHSTNKNVPKERRASTLSVIGPA